MRATIPIIDAKSYLQGCSLHWIIPVSCLHWIIPVSSLCSSPRRRTGRTI